MVSVPLRKIWSWYALFIPTLLSVGTNSTDPTQTVAFLTVFQVCGTEGMLTLDTAKQTTVKTFNARGSFDAPVSVSFPDRFEKAYKTELDHFIDVVQGLCPFLFFFFFFVCVCVHTS